MDTRARNQLRTTFRSKREKWGLGHQHERESSKTFHQKTALPENKHNRIRDLSPSFQKKVWRERGSATNGLLMGVIGTSKKDTVTALHFTFSAGV